jgi:hypothetical protein
MEENIRENRSPSPEKKDEELHLESFKQRIIQKYAKMKEAENSGENSFGIYDSGDSSSNSNSSESIQGVEDYYKKQRFQRNQSFVSQKTVIEEALLQKVKILENKNEKHMHMLKSAFLADDLIDKDFNQMMLIDTGHENQAKTMRKSKKENEKQEEYVFF